MLVITIIAAPWIVLPLAIPCRLSARLGSAWIRTTKLSSVALSDCGERMDALPFRVRRARRHSTRLGNVPSLRVRLVQRITGRRQASSSRQIRKRTHPPTASRALRQTPRRNPPFQRGPSRREKCLEFGAHRRVLPARSWLHGASVPSASLVACPAPRLDLSDRPCGQAPA